MQPRLPQNELQEEYLFPFHHDQLTATATVRLDKIPTGKKVRIDSVQYNNGTGLAGDNTNAFSLELKKNVGGSAALIALVFNTDTNDSTPGATLAADTWLNPSLTATDADRVLSGGDTLDLVFTEDGTSTLPPGRGVVRGRYV